MQFNFNKKRIKRNILIFFLFIIIANIWLYSIEYKRYVSQAPTHLKEARKDYVNATMFHIYYTFFVKTIRIDFQNPILYPLRASRDYFYHKGMKKLPDNEAERAMWFNMFEANLYNFSCHGKYGSMARRYGEKFATEFVDKVYENIKILSLNEFSDKKNPDIYKDSLESYINLITIYTSEFHLHPEGFIFRDENMQKVATDKKLHERFQNIYKWQKNFVFKYKKEDENQYTKVLNPSQGWYGAYKQYHDTRYIISSFILFYKIHNKLFDCEEDKHYLISIGKDKKILLKLVKNYPKTHMLYKTLVRKILYLHILNENENVKKDIQKYVLNPLKTKINCKTNKRNK